jgi:hypothetical protein
MGLETPALVVLSSSLDAHVNTISYDVMTYQMPMSSMDLYSIKSCKVLTYIGEIAENSRTL